MAIEDINGRPLKTENKASEEEQAMKEAMDGGRPLQVSRLREGQLQLAFNDTANKRIGAISYLKSLEMKKIQQKAVGEDPELIAMYKEVSRLNNEVMGLVAEINHRRADQDERRAAELDIVLYSDAEFFGIPAAADKGEG